jgi:hypothetical protein
LFGDGTILGAGAKRDGLEDEENPFAKVSCTLVSTGVLFIVSATGSVSGSPSKNRDIAIWE